MVQKDRANDHKSYLYRLGLLVFLAMMLILRSVWIFLGDREQFPINTIQIKAHYHCLNPKQVQAMLEPHLQDSFFTLSLRQLKKDLNEHPCLKTANIKRVWPDKIIISLREKEPFVRWNGALLTEEGELLPQSRPRYATPLVEFYCEKLPLKSTLKQYKNLSKILSDYGLSASIVTVSKNGAWDIALNNSVLIRLGKHRITKRLLRFAKAYAALEAEHDTPPLSVDLRYPSGMAVQWRA